MIKKLIFKEINQIEHFNSIRIKKDSWELADHTMMIIIMIINSDNINHINDFDNDKNDDNHDNMNINEVLTI
jgi:hypothetical protein